MRHQTLVVLFCLLAGTSALVCNGILNWKCASGVCIDIGAVCDGHIDCAGGDDELNCGLQANSIRVFIDTSFDGISAGTFALPGVQTAFKNAISSIVGVQISSTIVSVVEQGAFLHVSSSFPVESSESASFFLTFLNTILPSTSVLNIVRANLVSVVPTATITSASVFAHSDFVLGGSLASAASGCQVIGAAPAGVDAQYCVAQCTAGNPTICDNDSAFSSAVATSLGWYCNCAASVSPATATATPAATPVTSGDCIALQSFIDPQWCNDNCHHNPPYCPSAFCQCGSTALPTNLACLGLPPASDLWCSSSCNAKPAFCPSELCLCQDASNSCLGNCGSSGPDGCFCDDGCEDFDDCCGDYQNVCVQAHLSNRINCFAIAEPATTAWCMDNCNAEPAFCPANSCRCDGDDLSFVKRFTATCPTYSDEWCTSLCNHSPASCNNNCCQPSNDQEFVDFVSLCPNWTDQWCTVVCNISPSACDEDCCQGPQEDDTD